MASNFSVIENKFYNQIKNGIAFSNSLGQYTTSIKSNSGDVIKLVQTIELAVSVNLDETELVTISTLPFDATNAEIKANSIDWFAEGIYPTASIRVERGGLFYNITVLNITGVGNTKLIISDADMTAMIAALGLTDLGEYTDLTFKLISVPTHCIFKYKLNPLTLGVPNYDSPLDDNEQSYYAKAIPTSPTFETMAFLGGENGSSMAEVEIAYLTTYENYRHRFQINHIFKNPYYVSGEIINIQDAIKPALLSGSNTLKYDNYFEMGTSAYHNSIFNNYGLTGDCGYFNENYNGNINNYTIENVIITNASATGKLESTETNTLTFDVVTTGTWNAGVGGVLSHSKLPPLAEYQNKTEAFDSIWLFDNIFNNESGAAASSGIYTNFEFSITASDTISVSVDIDFSASQQLKISDTSYYALWFGIANEDLTDPDLIDRVNLIIDVDRYSKNTDVPSLITNYTPEFREEFRGLSGVSYTNFSGGDGDLWSAIYALVTDTTKQTTITKARFKIVADNGTESFLIGKPTNFPLGLPTVTTDGTYIYQIINVNTVNSLNVPEDVPVKTLQAIENVPASLPSTTQDVVFKVGFQVPWRDWIENLNVPLLAFYDPSEPNDNRNEKTSNYSNVSSYDIYGVLELTVSNNVEDTPTIYELYSDSSRILDFDSAGWVGFSGDVKLYDEDGIEVSELEDGRDLIIKIECTHGSGVLSPQTLAAFVWIEINGATASPSYLSSSFDYSSSENRLQPSDELGTGNTQYVEILSETNKVTLICKTNSDNLVAGLDYYIRGRLWHKI
jgi:hypothetical protein